jgi:VIT1/CCC1 family predicted Fe2+/Mn2+ transporter
MSGHGTAGRRWEVTSHDRHLHEHHRSLGGGEFRAAVFGVSDGLTSNVALVAGVAAAGVSASTVLAAGVAGLLAGAFSMAAGEWVSMRAHRELVAAELAKERAELARNPAGEHAELAELLAARGVRSEAAGDVAAELMVDPEVALVTHAREELGVDPDNAGNPVGAAAASFAAFALGAAVPIAPFVVSSASWVPALAVALAVLSAAAVGVLLARSCDQRVVPAVARQVGALVAAVTLTVLVGTLFGTAV